jgi:L-seryl-tRNA(Ser) seleniumtransferase
MMRLDRAAIRERSEVLVRAVSSQRSALTFEIRESESVIGGGAAPGATLPTFVIAIQHASISADELSARLRRNGPPIVTRVEEDRVILDLRTVFADEDELVRKALAEIG